MFALQNRALIISVAYSILGSYSDAEDVAQDVTEKWLQLDTTHVTNQKNYLIRLTVNHCLNHQQRQQRLQYKGQWLPEPVNNALLETSQTFELQDLLSYELATQLSRLSPYERAAFILKEAFELNHHEIAEIIDKTPDNTRQIFSRAKAKVNQYKAPVAASVTDKNKALQFALHIQQGDLEQLIALFKDDIQVFSDGGGKVTAARVPIIGAQKVANFYIKLGKNAPDNTRVVYDTVLGHPALLLYRASQLTGVVILSIHQGKIRRIYSVLNPDKLTKVI
ncbi:sigma-70 family RNA polymerase sigma factor [Microscilla marina]|uniref:RNA polymerase sigma-70 factor n=1 Tax=Microscilla marina ATCC 23134 TaxID=313606 RepID=A1ZH86_MICM2|nr:sigma-70 family RNA polymerase sigma factor [Microscilla marina]EAY30355.1 RNA polymerase sigma-70 factor [Microscilla marina ATCC 23134]